jgi:hypothetical protein
MPHPNRIASCTGLLLGALALLPGSAAARPCGQAAPCPAIELEGPLPTPYPPGDPLGAPATPAGEGVRPVSALAQDYVEEEFFVSGTTDVFNYAAHPAARSASPGDNLVVVKDDLPYRTRILVRRPARAWRFSRDVVIEFLNSTAGFDSDPSWIASAEYFARSGIVWIGVTTSANQSIPFLKGGCAGGITPPCGTRYATLDLTDNGQEYEIVSQLAAALRSGDPAQIPLPAHFPPVRHVFVGGQSQQGGSVITHLNEFHFDAIAGYFFQGATSSRLIRGPASGCTAPVANPGLACVATVPPGPDRFPRRDLPVPVYQGMSETDVFLLGGVFARQDDLDTTRFASFRLVEVAASAHNLVHETVIPLFGVKVGDLCLELPNTAADGPIFAGHVWNAMWENLRRQVRWGILPPHAPRMQSTPAGQPLRDALGNALGGVRLPELSVPTNSYFSFTNTGKPTCGSAGAPPPPDCLPALLSFVGNLACLLTGSYEPLPQETLDELYRNHGKYVSQIVQRSLQLVGKRFLLLQDAVDHIVDAAHSDVGK